VGRFVPGIVYLVGAGPGVPDLITLRALRILRTADAVLYDALLSPELLLEAKPDAELLSVGKRGYCIGSTNQETIHEALIRLAREGKTVCRLKCGDPCLFGRGGEEAEALAAKGIEVVIVPGVTSALGAAAVAGIPLTHREIGPSVTFATGHHDPDSEDCKLDWPMLARSPAVVFYMAVRHIERIAAKLIECGMPATTAAAIIENGTLTNQREIIADLEIIGDLGRSANVQAPALFIVGEVVRHRVPPRFHTAFRIQNSALVST
jgi:uroporphyrin-III C-methyltransferase